MEQFNIYNNIQYKFDHKIINKLYGIVYTNKLLVVELFCFFFKQKQFLPLTF